MIESVPSLARPSKPTEPKRPAHAPWIQHNQLEPYERPVSVEDPAVLLERHRDDVLRVLRYHGVRRAWVFGSVARKESRPGSDLDLLIEPGEDLPPWFPGGLLVDLEKTLACSVDILEMTALHPLIRDQIVSERKALL